MIWPAGPAEPQTADARAETQFSFAGPIRRAAGSETGKHSIGLAEGAGPFEQMLLEILLAVGWRGEQRRLFEVMPHLDPIASVTMLRTVLARLDVGLIKIGRGVGKLSARDFPCLVVDGETSCRLVTATSAGVPRIYDLATRTESSDLGSLRGTIYLLRTDNAEEIPAAPSADGYVEQVLRALRGQLLRIAGQSALISMLGIALSLYVLLVYDLVIATGSLDTLAFLAGGALVGLTCELCLYRTRSKSIAYVATRFDGAVQIRTLSSVLNLPLALTERAPLSSQLSRFRQFEIGREIFAGGLASALLDLPFTLLFVAMLFVIGGSLAFVPLGIALVTVAVAALSAPISIAQVTKIASNKLKSDAMLLELTDRRETIRSAAAETKWLARYGNRLATYARSRFDNVRLSSSLQVITNALVAFAGVVTLGVGAQRVMEDSMSLGALVVAMMLVWRILQPVQVVSLNLPRLRQIRTTIRQINDLMRMRAERDDAIPMVFHHLRGSIFTSGLYLSMGAQQEPQLRGVNLDIKAGQIIAITGPSGSGKSTLLKVLLGLYPQYMGTVRLGGFDMRQFDPEEVRAAIAYAPNHPMFFNGTVAANLRFGFPDATDHDIIGALAAVGIRLPDPHLPDGIETPISGTAVRSFSQGLLCRLSLARAFVKKSSILLLDDSHNGLDPAGDDALTAHLNTLRGTTTVLFVTARPRHMRVADRVLVMSAGVVVASGKPDAIVPTIAEGLQPNAA
jgi:ABC-type bacteriocin/lantibiotic exporter with double-glycine peptidase domain